MNPLSFISNLFNTPEQRQSIYQSTGITPPTLVNQSVLPNMSTPYGPARGTTSGQVLQSAPLTGGSGSGGGGGTGGGGAAAPTSPTVPTAPEGPSQDDFNNALSEYFAPAAARLDTLRSNAEAGLPLAEQKLRTSHEEALVPLEERLTTGLQGIEEQRGETAEGRENTISSIRRFVNEAAQRGLTRFGAGSSAGGAFSEIVGREAAGQLGQAENIATKAFSKLSTDARNLQDFVGRQKTVLAQKLEDGLNTVREEFRNRIAEIDAQRGQLEQAKAQAKLDELATARQRAFDLQDAADAYARQIDLFEREKESQLAQQYAVNQGVSTEALNLFSKLAPSVGYVAAANLTGIDPSQLQGVVAPYGSAQYRDLGNGLLQNIQTGEVVDAYTQQ